MQFGSHVYGTNTPSSDTDYKSLFIPDARDIIIQKAAKHIQNNTKLDPNARNTKDDIDDEQFSVSEYLRLLCEGQTMALDMLFTPESFYLDHYKNYSMCGDNPWYIIKANKDKFLHKGVSAFIGYTKTQAAKYGVKGFRIAALKETIDFLDICEYSKLAEKKDLIEEFVKKQDNEFIKITDIKGPNGSLEPHLEVCNRKVPFHANFKYAKEIFQRIYNNYGARAMLAEKNEGIDWKALMHAVRVAREAEELLLTGNITFPRPEKDLLLKIRKGEMAYKEVEQIIEEGLNNIDIWQAKSILPEKPDYKFVEQLVHEFNLDAIKAHYYDY